MHTFVLVSLSAFHVWSLPSSSTAFLKEERYELRTGLLFHDSSLLTGFPLSSHIFTRHSQGRSRDPIFPKSPLNSQELSENKPAV